MSESFYRVAHIVGLVTLFLSLGGILAFSTAGVTLTSRTRALLSAGHGLGLVALLVSGFGMLAKLGYLKDLPTWSIVKMVIWLLIGGSVALAKRRPAWGGGLVAFWIAAGGLAAYLCIYKPG
jgi:hypothetical protein